MFSELNLKMIKSCPKTVYKYNVQSTIPTEILADLCHNVTATNINV